MAETIIVSGHQVSTFRKNNTKFVLSLRDRLFELLRQGEPLEKIRGDLEQMVSDYKKKRSTSIYISYLGITEWHERESLAIRDASFDTTLVNCWRVDKAE